MKLIEKYFDPNFESNLFENITPRTDNQLDFYKNLMPSLDSIIKRILSSPAAKKFFYDYYGKKYNGLKYHFDREDVQNEIFKKMNFAPLFNRKEKAYTNPIDMSITINTLPGKIDDIQTHSFNRKILHFGRILVFCLHEILGPFLRRYYSYFTGGIISFNNEEDMNIHKGGIYVEYKFLGLKNELSISLWEILCLLCSPLYLDYPLIKNYKYEFNEEILKTIISENENLFDFIVENNPLNKMNEKTEAKIVLVDYLDIIKTSQDKYKVVPCYKTEKYSIYLDNFYDF